MVEAYRKCCLSRSNFVADNLAESAISNVLSAVINSLLEV